ncbi:hypothetical protein IZU99_04630 [Oscillospiraceae bacterium CM]|nr:hypothetical protein IZU99_04630 [Oscillospiraceae bacterium CM]
MGWYDVAKDAISIAQKIDNVELIQKIIELQTQMLDMQEENRILREQVQKNDSFLELESKLERHKEPYYSIKHGDHTENICANCWNQYHFKSLFTRQGGINYICSKCGTKAKIRVNESIDLDE